MDWPKGFTNIDARKALADRIQGMVAAFDSSIAEKYKRYELTQDVYDDKEVMSSLDFLPDYQPYNLPFSFVRSRALVQNVCGGYTATSPYWMLKDGEDEEAQDAAQSDLTKAFEMADFDLEVRKSGRIAVNWSRGPMRLTYQTLSDEDMGDTLGADEDEDVNYSGLVVDTFKTKRFILYPTNSKSPAKATLVGHWWEETNADAQEKQNDGIYDKETDLSGSDDSGQVDGDSGPTVTDKSEDAPLKHYDLLVRYRAEGDSRRRWWRVIWNETHNLVLRIEEYDAPTPNYFCPTFESEVDEFFAECTPGSRNLELQALINDAISLKVFGGAQTAFLTVLASGFISDGQTMRMGIGQLIGYKGNPNFTVLPTRFDPRAMESVADDVERYGDGATGASQMAQGQELEGDKTAAEVNAVAAGTMGSLQEQRVEFGVEIRRMAKHGLFLLGKHFDEWSRFNNGCIKAKSAEAYKYKYNLETTGKTASNTPEAVIAKVKALLAAAKELGIPITPTLMNLNAEELFNMIINALQFHVSTAKLIQDPNQQPIDNAEIPPFDINSSPLGPAIGASATGPGPEELALLLEMLGGGGDAAGMAPGLPPGYAVGAPGAVGLPGAGELPGLPLGIEGALAAA